MADKLAYEKSKLELNKSALKRLSPSNYIDNLTVRCDKAQMAIDSAVHHSLAVRSKDFSALCAKLDAMSPLRILARGYSIAEGKDGIITDACEVSKGDKVSVRLHKGTIECEVINKTEG